MPDLAISTALDGRYRLDALIGRGGMADVYRGHDLRLDRDVAVKVLREVEHERRFEVEVHTLATLDHPNLVRLLDAGDDDGHVFLVMELLGGASVLELLAGGPVAPERVRDIAREAAAGLADIHDRGIVHRDVKPSNLMFDEHGTLRIADFGIVHLVDGATLTGTHQTIGTMAYLAPEQLRGRDITPAADVYALGLVLLECLTGRRAFTGAPAEAAAARLHHDPEVPASLPAPWPEVLRAMTAGDPASRPSARDVRDRLAATEPMTVPLEPATATAVLPAAAVEAAALTVPIAVAVGDVEAPRTRRSRPRLVVGMLAVAFVIAIVAGVWAATNDGSSVNPAISPSTTTPPTAAAPVVTTTPPPPPTTSAPVVVDDGGGGKGNEKGPGHGPSNGRGGKKGDD